jgi:multiple sugar transport system substrate-binding protein
MKGLFRDRVSRPAVLILWGGLFLGTAALILVFALPGPPSRQYPDRIPVRFWHMWTSDWKVVVERVVQRFNESQDRYEVIPLSVPGTGADSKFLLSVAGGDPPDVMAQWNQVIPKWAESGLIIPLNNLMTPEEWEAFQRTTYPAALKIGMYQGNLYGVTTGLDVHACFCRLADLREAGLDPGQFPQTLEELVQWGERLQKLTPEGRPIRIGFLPIMFAMYAPGFGGGFYDWTSGELTLDTPENLRALTFLVNERKKLGFENVVRFESGLSIGTAHAQWPFISGAYSITVDGQWRVEQIAQYDPDLEYATFPLPPPEGGRRHFGWVNGNFMVIPAGAKEAQGAWEFIKFWSGIEEPERAAEFYTWGGWLPMNPMIAEAPKYQEYVRKHPQFETFLELLPSENLHPAPPVPYQVYLWDRIIRADDAAQRGTLSPEAAIQRLKQDVAQEMATRREFGYKDAQRGAAETEGLTSSGSGFRVQGLKRGSE